MFGEQLLGACKVHDAASGCAHFLLSFCFLLILSSYLPIPSRSSRSLQLVFTD
jgi:hypothetical protein